MSTGLPFQETPPAASIRMRIGGGGMPGGGGMVLGCGRSTWIGYDSGGTVTMKMISSTSMMSTRGVTLMSAIGPPPELEANAISNPCT